MKDKGVTSQERSLPADSSSRAVDAIGVEEVSALMLFNVLLRRRHLVVRILVFTVFAALLLWALTRSADFTAVSKFMPEGARIGSSGMAGLAAQLGIAGAGDEAGSESIEFYAALVRSRELLREVAQFEYQFPIGPEGRDSLKGSLIDLYEVDGDTQEERVRAAVSILEQQVATEVDGTTGLVTVKTTAPWRPLAVSVNERLLTLIDEYNSEKRRSHAKEERIFVEARMREAKQQLLAAETKLSAFFDNNRRIAQSPPLLIDAERLQREVRINQELYIELVKSYQQARISEVRNTPVITVFERPEMTVHRTGSNLLLNLVFGVVLGTMLAVVVVFWREYLERQREQHPEDYREFRQLRKVAVAEISPRRLAAIVRPFRRERDLAAKAAENDPIRNPDQEH